MRSSIKQLAFLTITGIAMILFTGCSREEIQTADNENLILKVDDTQTRTTGPSASGHGTLSFEGIPIEGEGFRQFSFHAREKSNGDVQGSGVLTYIGGVRNLAFDVTCLSVDGNHAIMSGVTTRDNQFPENVGLLFWFEVFDNGEGNNADPDQMSLYFQGTNPAVYDCANDFTVDLYEIEGGNVQVRE